jgi:ATP-dependent protease HslVU (ClpYQ) peptidase subunit
MPLLIQKLDKGSMLSGFAAAAVNVDLGTSFKLINVLDPTLKSKRLKKLCRYCIKLSNDLAIQMYLWVILVES